MSQRANCDRSKHRDPCEIWKVYAGATNVQVLDAIKKV